jgi:hypothetical protein
MLDAMPPLHDAGSGPEMRALGSDVEDPYPSGNLTSRLTGNFEPRMAPMRCLVIDHLCRGLNRSRPTTTDFAVKSS